MAFFTKFCQIAFKPVQTTIISAGTRVNGDIQTECELHIDGELHGALHAKKCVSIGESGVMKGDLVADEFIVSGRFKGTADCQEIQILAGGKVLGQLSCQHLSIEKGGIFNGRNKHKGSPAGIKRLPVQETSLTRIDTAAV